MVPDRMKYIDYTDPYMIEYASFMLSKYRVTNTTKLYFHFHFSAKPPNPPQWLRILQPLQTSTWIGMNKTIVKLQTHLPILRKHKMILGWQQADLRLTSWAQFNPKKYWAELNNFSLKPISILLKLLGLFAAILSTTVFLSLISKASSWNNNPHFGLFDCKFVCNNIMSNIINSWIKVFVFGTLVEQNQARLSKLQSSSIKLFVGLWIFSLLIITQGY